MTKTRRKFLTGVAATGIVAGTGVIVGGGVVFPPLASAKKPARWSNLNGIAIRGYDPASYFLFNEARRGKTKFSFRFDGANWIFENADTRQKFQQRAKDWAPAFGGYDVTMVAQGKLVDPNPENWQIEDERLFLFSSPAAREAFLADRDTIIDTAVRRWSALFGSSDR